MWRALLLKCRSLELSSFLILIEFVSVFCLHVVVVVVVVFVILLGSRRLLVASHTVLLGLVLALCLLVLVFALTGVALWKKLLLSLNFLMLVLVDVIAWKFFRLGELLV